MDLERICPEPEDTLAVGDRLGRCARPGLVVLLQGALGAGKTVFTKGVARGLGVAGWRYVTSPTFAIHNVYPGRLPLHHLDLYRLGSVEDLESVGAEDALYGPGLCVIEWPDSFFGELPAEHLLVRFSWGAGGHRILHFEAVGREAGVVLQDLKEGCTRCGPREEGEHDL